MSLFCRFSFIVLVFLRNLLRREEEWGRVSEGKPPEGDVISVQTLVDFLAFRHFISPAVLPVCYVLGAAGIPFGVWLAVQRMVPFLGKQAAGPYRSGAEDAPAPRYRGRILFWCTLLFVVAEILWRILFEYLAAFLQMRDALLFLVNGH